MPVKYMEKVIESASACVAVTLIACGNMSFAIVLAAAVSCGDTRSTVNPVPVMAALVKIVYSVPDGLTPAIVNTTDGVADTAVTSMKNNPSVESVSIVADDVAVRAALA